MSIESVMPSSHLILCRPFLLLPPIPPSIGVFSNESTLRMRWPKYCSFSFSISSSNEHPGLISFRMGWLDLLAVQGALKSLLQHHSSKAEKVGGLIHLYLLAQACPTLRPMGCSPPAPPSMDSPARRLGWGAMPSSRRHPPPRDRSHSSCLAAAC